MGVSSDIDTRGNADHFAMIGPAGRRAVFIVGIVGAVLSAGAAVVCPMLGVVGGLLTVTVISYQYFFAGPVTIDFGVADWTKSEDGWVIEIRRAQHGRRSPTATIGKWDENGRWTEVWANARVSKDSTVHLVLNSGEPFDGQLRIS